LDVRTAPEYAGERLRGAVNVPLDELRERLKELDPGRETVVYCRVGYRGYLAARVLAQSGFQNVWNLSGGILAAPESLREHRGEPVAGSCAGRGDSESATSLADGNVSVEQLKERLDRNDGDMAVVDVREEDEFRFERIPGTVNVPLSRLSQALKDLPGEKTIYVLCQSGVRSATAAGEMRKAAFKRVFSVKGGVSAWKRAGHAVAKSKGPLPIMRQVQIAAGALVVLGLLVPHLWGLSLFVGAGLVFAGVSGFCGLAAVLARMPWNRMDPGQAAKSFSGGGSCGPCGS
jgi:rhodanese-related sulfurtransferase